MNIIVSPGRDECGGFDSHLTKTFVRSDGHRGTIGQNDSELEGKEILTEAEDSLIHQKIDDIDFQNSQ